MENKILIIWTAIAAGTIVLVGLVWAIGVVFDCEYPYWLLLKKVQTATSVSGMPFSEAINKVYPSSACKAQWHISSYSLDRFKAGKNIIYLKLVVTGEVEKCFHFAYNIKLNRIAPASTESRKVFPMPIIYSFETEPRFTLGDGISCYLIYEWGVTGIKKMHQTGVE